MTLSQQSRRALVALVLVAGSIALIPACDGAADAINAVKTVQESAEPTQQAKESDLQKETFSVADLADAHVNQWQDILGFSLEMQPDQALLWVQEKLEQAGWTMADDAVPACACFTKEAGKYRWLTVSCILVAGQTSVVMTAAAV